MAMGPLMGALPLATTPRPQVAAVHSSGQSTWQRGWTLLGSVNVHPSSRCVKRCVPVVKAIKNPTPKVAAAPVAEPAAKPSSGCVANEDAPKDLAHRWREIGGEKDWKGQLDPLDLTLRKEILRYGEFVQATYDNFEFEYHSKYCGCFRYNKDKMFSEVGLENSGYEVHCYFYATDKAKKSSWDDTIKWFLHFFENKDRKFFKNPLVQFFLKPILKGLKKLSSEVLTKPLARDDPWSKDSNWMGYIAVSTDKEKIKQLGRRDIVIAWRGTVRDSEWAGNIKFRLSPGLPGFEKKAQVHRGFLSWYTSDDKTLVQDFNIRDRRYNKTSAREQVLTGLKHLLEEYKNEAKLSITICGHSLGSALSTITAFEIAKSGLNIRGKHAVIAQNWSALLAMEMPDRKHLETIIPITVFSFGGPPVGNHTFRDRLEELDVKILRIVNPNDLVPRLLGLPINWNTALSRWVECLLDILQFTYVHVGTELKVDNGHSKYLDPDRAGFSTCHNMEQYLHLIDGHHGTEENFELTTKRPLALVNKSCDFLKDEYFIPGAWRQRENKGWVWRKDHRWVCTNDHRLVWTEDHLLVEKERPKEDIPTPHADSKVKGCKSDPLRADLHSGKSNLLKKIVKKILW